MRDVVVKKILVFLVLSLSALTISGCATVPPPTQQQIQSADYGALPDNYKEQIQGALSVTLKDPYTAQYSFLQPFKGYSQDGSWTSTNGAVYYGWVVPVMVNAKNSYGGYTGAKKYVFIFTGGKLFDTTINDQFNRVVPVK